MDKAYINPPSVANTSPYHAWISYVLASVAKPPPPQKQALADVRRGLILDGSARNILKYMPLQLSREVLLRAEVGTYSLTAVQQACQTAALVVVMNCTAIELARDFEALQKCHLEAHCIYLIPDTATAINGRMPSATSNTENVAQADMVELLGLLNKFYVVHARDLNVRGVGDTKKVKSVEVTASAAATAAGAATGQLEEQIRELKRIRRTLSQPPPRQPPPQQSQAALGPEFLKLQATYMDARARMAANRMC